MISPLDFTIRRFVFFYLLIILTLADPISAQTLMLGKAPYTASVDGIATEWGMKLPFSSKASKISYNITTDNNMLFFVIKTEDLQKQGNILGAGITLSIDPKGNKFLSHALTFPQRTEEDPEFFLEMEPEDLEIRSLKTKYKKIGVSGFARIKETELGITNQYGIKFAIGYLNGEMTYEASIPFAIFDVDRSKASEWAFNISINGLHKKIRVISSIVYAFAKVPQNASKTGDNLGSTYLDIPKQSSKVAGLIYEGRNKTVATALEITPNSDFWIKFVVPGKNE